MLMFLREFFAYVRARKKYWLIPLFLALILLGGLVLLSEGSVVAPFIYTIF